VKSGKVYVVDVDLEKYFDSVNHDRLMSRLSKAINDKRVLILIRRYLTADLLQNGLVEQRQKGTPQGGPLSPLLSNIVLDELEKSLSGAVTHFVATPTTATSMSAVRQQQSGS